MLNFKYKSMQVKVALLVIFAGLYNAITYIFDSFTHRVTDGEIWPFVSLITQLILVIYLIINLKTNKLTNKINRHLFFVLILWLITSVVNGKNWIFDNEIREWPYWHGLLQMNFFPIIDITLDTPTPLFGLFHSNKGNIWTDPSYFDGGIAFSWYLFNIFSMCLIVILIDKLRREYKTESISKTLVYCSSCGTQSQGPHTFCFNCGAKSVST